MSLRVAYTRRARSHLTAIERYISRDSSPEIACRFVDAVVAKCDGLANFPLKGSPRHDLGPRMRSIAFRSRVTIVYSVEPETVLIVGVFYAGQDIRDIRSR